MLIGGLTFLDGNTVDDRGGAIKIDNGMLMVGHSRFVNNSAMIYGGAIAATNASVIMDSVFFSMNQCIQGDGGGFFVENNQPDHIQGCFIVKRYPYRKHC